MNKELMERFEQIWADLSEGVQQIYAGQQLPTRRYWELYTHVVTVVATMRKSNYNNKIKQHHHDRSMGKDLYYRLKAFITKHVNNLCEQLMESEQGEIFLEDYIAQWNAYKRASAAVECIFNCLNSNWIKREMREKAGNKEVCKVYDLALNIWKTELFDKCLHKIKQCVFNALIAEENGSAEDKVRIRASLKAVSEAFFGLGIKRIFQLTHKPEEAELVCLLALF